MQAVVQLNNKTSYDFSRAFFEKILKETLRQLETECLTQTELQLSVALIEEEEIKEINSKYRQKDKPTDVLSFAEYEQLTALCAAAEKQKELLLGELIICPSYVEKSARMQDFSLENEFVYIVSHGILHLLGFDHEEEMFAIQQRVVDNIFEIKII